MRGGRTDLTRHCGQGRRRLRCWITRIRYREAHDFGDPDAGRRRPARLTLIGAVNRSCPGVGYPRSTCPRVAAAALVAWAGSADAGRCAPLGWAAEFAPSGRPDGRARRTARPIVRIYCALLHRRPRWPPVRRTDDFCRRDALNYHIAAVQPPVEVALSAPDLVGAAVRVATPRLISCDRTFSGRPRMSRLPARPPRLTWSGLLRATRSVSSKRGNPTEAASSCG
jgi:hypothetical protein